MTHCRAVPGSAYLYRRLLQYVRPYRLRVGLAVGAATISSAAAAAYSYLIGPLLKSLFLSENVVLAGREVAGKTLVWALPTLVVGAAVIKAGFQFLHTGWMRWVGQRAVADLRRDLYSRLLALPPKFFETRHSGELLSRFTSDVAQVEFAVAQALSSYFKDTLMILGQLTLCLVLDARLFLIAFVVLPVSILPISRFAKAVKRVATKTQASLGQITELAAEQLNNLSVVQAFRAEPALLRTFDAEQSRYLSAMQNSLLLRGAFSPTLEILGVIGAAAAIALGARAVAADPRLAANLLSFLTAALLVYQPIKALAGTFSLVLQGVGAAQRLFEVTDHPPERETGGSAPKLSTALELVDVHADYGDGATVLQGLNLCIQAGQRVALVGPSGAGKSTVVSLLLGFLSPSRGDIRWNGEALSSLSIPSMRAQLAWVPQEPVLFSGSVKQNLLLGRADASDAEIWDALRRANADSFVRAFPKALDEEVGERGARLSGGQRQRLAIARAFLRKPSLLLLDEPTSALDAASEQEVQVGLRELLHSTTALIIAHRLATVRDADVIAVLEAGRIVESGSHDELIARGGRYRALLASLEGDAPPRAQSA